MTRQLVLIDPGTTTWRLDEATRESGRRGVALARSALRAAQQRARSHEARGQEGPDRATPTTEVDAA